MEQLRLCERREHGAVVLVVAGELDLVTGPQLDRHLSALAATGDHHVVLDAADLVFCDASGITVLLRGRARAYEQQGWLRLVAARALLRRILVITALTRELPVFDTVADAVASMNADSPPGGTSTQHKWHHCRRAADSPSRQPPDRRLAQRRVPGCRGATG